MDRPYFRTNGGDVTTAWEPVHQPRTHELVLERIEQQVMEGQLRAGDRLPPERQLASALGVSRSAVREAARILEAFGVLVTRAGRGPDAGAVITTDPTSAVGRMLRLHLALGSYRLDDILEARVMFERASVTGAARNPEATELDRAAEILQEMEDPRLSEHEYNELDTKFHVHLAHCSGNELTRTLTAAVRESVRPLVLQGFEDAPDWRETAARLQTEHHRILEHIRAGEPDKAAQAVEDHIRGFHGKLTDASR